MKITLRRGSSLSIGAAARSKLPDSLAELCARLRPSQSAATQDGRRQADHPIPSVSARRFVI
jgi:hypothetical protein